jgi:hypothetical protein
LIARLFYVSSRTEQLPYPISKQGLLLGIVGDLSDVIGDPVEATELLDVREPLASHCGFTQAGSALISLSP